MGIEDWFKERECSHWIGDNNSEEVYLWEGRNPTPREHYVLYRCEGCGRNIKNLISD